jgi:predicted HicB family RNase H-like nuclease
MPETIRENTREESVYAAAAELYRQTPDWVHFFREVLGLGGVIRRYYPTQELLAEFEQTETYGAIQQMLSKLRERSGDNSPSPEPTRVITVRLPKSLHDAIRAEAHEHRTSMNKLCISKLLQFIDNEFVPGEP